MNALDELQALFLMLNADNDCYLNEATHPARSS